MQCSIEAERHLVVCAEDGIGIRCENGICQPHAGSAIEVSFEYERRIDLATSITKALVITLQANLGIDAAEPTSDRCDALATGLGQLGNE